MMLETDPREWRYIYAAIVVAAAALFLYSVHAVLSPLFIYVLLLLVLAPYRGTDRYTTIVIAATLALALWLLEALGGMLAPFILAFVLAYILDPVVDALQRRTRMKRGLAVACVVGPGARRACACPRVRHSGTDRTDRESRAPHSGRGGACVRMARAGAHR